MLVVYDVDKLPDELVDELDRKIRDGEIESAKALARALFSAVTTLDLMSFWRQRDVGYRMSCGR